MERVLRDRQDLHMFSPGRWHGQAKYVVSFGLFEYPEINTRLGP
jgi:hypothetical protein